MNVCTFCFESTKKWQKKILQYREQPSDIKFHYLNLYQFASLSLNLTLQQPYTLHIEKINLYCRIGKKLLVKISYFSSFFGLLYSAINTLTSLIKSFISVSFVPS